MNFKKKVLVVAGGIWIPAVKVAGTKGLYEFIRRFSIEDKYEIHVLTSVASWADKDFKRWFLEEESKYKIKFHFIKAGYFESIPFLNLILTRIHLFFKIICLHLLFRFDIIHEYVSTPILFVFSIFYKMVFRVRVIYTLVTSNCYFLNKYKIGFVDHFIDKVLFLSKSQLNKFSLMNLDFDVSKVSFLPLGLTLKGALSKKTDKKLRSQLLKGNKRIILNIGPLEERKGVFTLINAFKRLKTEMDDVICIFVSYGKSGVDQFHKQSKERIKRELRNSCYFLEGQQDVLSLMKVCDVFVLPLDSMHGTLSQPLTLLEAMACGCCCVVSDLDEIKDIVIDGKTGFLFKAKDSDSLFETLKECLNKTCLNVKKNAKKEIIDCYDIKKNIYKLVEFYDELFK